MDTRITIRQAIESDISDLSELYLDFLESYGHEAEREGIARFLRQLLSESWVFFFVAVNYENKIVGFAGCVLSYSSVSQAAAITINDIYVEADARRHGVATALCQKIEAYTLRHGHSKIYVQTAHDYEPAIDMFKKNGYELRPYLTLVKELRRV